MYVLLRKKLLSIVVNMMLSPVGVYDLITKHRYKIF